MLMEVDLHVAGTQKARAKIERAPSFPQHGPSVLSCFDSCCLLRALNFLRKTNVISFRVFSIDSFPFPFQAIISENSHRSTCLILICLDGDASVLTGHISVSRAGIYKSVQSLSQSKSCPYLKVVLNYLRHVAFLWKGTLCVLAGLQYNTRLFYHLLLALGNLYM